MTRVELPGSEIVGIRAANPGPFTLAGTNSWIVGRDPAWLVDPGPALDEHLAALTEEIERRGGLGGIVLTHDHVDHAEAVPAIRERFAGGRWRRPRRRRRRLATPAAWGRRGVATPGHAPDHLAYVVGDVALTGDAVLGEGSVFIAPDPARSPPTSTGCGGCAGASCRVGPGHGPRWTIPRPSSTSTSRIASTASGG